VIYDDALLDDDFYTPGEGLGSVTVVATRTSDGAQYSTTSWTSGGYTLELPAGTWNLEASGGGLAAAIQANGIVIGTLNVKQDFVPGRLPGDANGDGKVDGGDLAIWQQHYNPLSGGGGPGAGDFNDDGKTDGGDLALWQTNYDPLGIASIGSAGSVTEGVYKTAGRGRSSAAPVDAFVELTDVLALAFLDSALNA
jgi:hypothetical protein